MKLKLILLIYIFIPLYMCGQKVKKRVNKDELYTEKYFVLKSNKGIKHGHYIKFMPDLIGREFPVEIGSYAYNKKDGTWFSFYGNGYLSDYGIYINDYQQGLWREFYQPKSSSNISLGDFINPPNDVQQNSNGEIVINIENKSTASEGIFRAGEKDSIWQYFNKEGVLVHTYNHSLDSLIFQKDSSSLPFLGGANRFYSQFNRSMSKRGQIHVASPVLIQIAVLNANDSICFKSVGKDKTELSTLYLEVLESTQKNWIKELMTKPVLLKWEYVIGEKLYHTISTFEY